jgi:hypothetical protein
MEIWPVVAVVDVKESSIHDWTSQVKFTSSIIIQFDIQAMELYSSVIVDNRSCFIKRQKRMSEDEAQVL